uniref:Putative secreted peptide n=1 Tax=Anopheles braziliensis TaxID=58242 RepID=A0A2M3ZS82_9DIPT
MCRRRCSARRWRNFVAICSSALRRRCVSCWWTPNCPRKTSIPSRSSVAVAVFLRSNSSLSKFSVNRPALR